ncbi:MAG: phosphoribosylamine--glycine ligase [Verrucomicrobiales bacterium]|jgi:phosphoribosylamine--glycine ligase|nr:phosphoribosylamine--glycine ligase [Verrucomicrobiales bacterium]
MKILVVGSGGREHAIGWALARDARVARLYFAPGNAGTAALGENVPLQVTDLAGLRAWCERQRPDLVVVGPEAPLCAGLVDELSAAGVPAFGPGQAGARLEASKIFTKDLLAKAGVPTAASARFTEVAAARAYCAAQRYPLVVKADGLAAGKGVIIAPTLADADAALEQIMARKIFGAAGDHVLIEEFLPGQEASIHAVTDGADYVLLPSAQDHKRIRDDDEGPNTGGMGAYAPAPIVSAALLATIERTVIQPVITALRDAGIDYRGVLYAGLMLTPDGPKVLEFNCRFGDPETEVLLPLLETPLLDLLLATVERRLGKLRFELKQGSALTVVLAAPGYPEHPVTGQVIHGLNGASPLLFHAGTARREDGRVTVSGGRVLAATGVGHDLHEARRRAYRMAADIRFEGKQYRLDIGRKALDLLEKNQPRTAPNKHECG